MDDCRGHSPGQWRGSLRAVRRAVKNEQVVLIGDLQGLVNAAELLNGNVRLDLMLKPAGPPLETRALRDIEVGDLHAPFLGGKFAGEKAGEGALPTPPFWETIETIMANPDFLPNHHANMRACEHVKKRIDLAIFRVD